MRYEKLMKALSDRGWSKRQLAHQANIASQDLYQVLGGKRPFYPNWKKRVAEALDMDEAELFEEE